MSKSTIKMTHGQTNPVPTNHSPPLIPLRSIAAATVHYRSQALQRAVYRPARFEDQSISICGTCGTASCCNGVAEDRGSVFMATSASIDNDMN